MIALDHLCYTYPADEAKQSPTPVLNDVSLSIGEGEFVLVVGPSGSGKSTLLRCMNGLVPHFYGGVVSGQIRVDGRDPVALGPRRLSGTVGFVFQDPEAQAVVDLVEDELVFAMENHGLSRQTMLERVQEVLDQLDIGLLRRRRMSSLSGGERQRVAIAAVLTMHPKVLVLDEPTSQLDPQSAEEVLDALQKLNQNFGLTVLLAEHRLERVVQYADRILYMPGPAQDPLFGPPQEILHRIPLVPPLVDLGRKLGWTPLPLTVQSARTRVRALVSRLAPLDRTGPASWVRGEIDTISEEPAIELQGVQFGYGRRPALHDLDLVVRRGELVAVMGRNGAGKSTLLKHCIGLLSPDRGSVRVLGHDTRGVAVEDLAREVGYVPQNPNALLFADTVADELAFTRQAQNLAHQSGTRSDLDTAFLQTLGLAGMASRYPRDMSGGERQRVALAAVLVGDPALILLDEPTRGLDYPQKAALAELLQKLRTGNWLGAGGTAKTILMVTHDVELVAQCADRVVLMEEGTISIDGPVREVMSGTLRFSSQISRLFRDPRFLTVADVLTAERQQS